MLEIIILAVMIIQIVFLKKESAKRKVQAKSNKNGAIIRNMSHTEQLLRIGVLLTFAALILRIIWRFGSWVIGQIKTLFSLSSGIWTIIIVIGIATLLIWFLLQKLEKYKVLRIIGVAIILIVTTGIISRNITGKKIDTKFLTPDNSSKIAIATPTTSAKPVVPDDNDIRIIHCTADSTAYYLHWGKNVLEPGRRYYFNNEIPIRFRLVYYDTLNVTNEGYESHAHWKIARDSTDDGTKKMNYHNDGDALGCYYMFVTKTIETGIYRP